MTKTRVFCEKSDIFGCSVTRGIKSGFPVQIGFFLGVKKGGFSRFSGVKKGRSPRLRNCQFFRFLGVDLGCFWGSKLGCFWSLFGGSDRGDFVGF